MASVARVDPLADLLAGTARGDRSAFERLYEQTKGRMMAAALRVVGQREVAEEVLQEAYLAIWSKAAQQRAGARPIGWMLAVVRHRAIDRLRRRDARPATTSLSDVAEAAAPGLVAADESACALMSDSVRRCVGELEAARRQALLLAYYQGMTHEEIARALDAPLGTVKSWVRRALAQLRDCLACGVADR